LIQVKHLRINMEKNFLKIAGNIHLSYYVEAADILGIDYKILVHGLMAEFSVGSKHWFVINTVNPLVPTPSTTICKRKNLTHLVLKEHGVKVPEQEILSCEIDAIKFFNNYRDIVIKPTQQLGGKGVSILPQNEEQVLKAYKNAFDSSHAPSDNQKVIGEQFIHGENYRFLVLGDTVIGIVRRKAAHVIGDGEHTIRELINLTNIERKANVMLPIIIDNEVILKLQRENMNLDYTPNKGEEVILRYNCNLTTGGTTEECAKEAHDYYKQLAVKAVKAIGSEFGGVDIIAKDITKPDESAINEINYNPGLRLHYKVDKGEKVKVAIPIMEYIRDKYLS